MTSPNQRIIDHLTDICQVYRINGEKYKVRALEKAIASIRETDLIITSGSDARKLKGVGDSIAAKIDEIISTKDLKFLMNDKLKEEQEVCALFETVWGIGPSKAKALYLSGYRTLDDLRNNSHELTHAQSIGLETYDDIAQRIPRSEVDEFKLALDDLLKDVTFQICGSYRRGATDCGDIDLLITADNITDLLPEILRRLDPFLTHTLSKGPTKFMGIMKIDRVYRRIDIRVIEKHSWALALLYFTGSKETNIKMRNRAIEKGWKLSEYDLMDQDGKYIVVNTERDIFNLLNLDYIEPNFR